MSKIDMNQMLAMTPEQAVSDIASFMEDMILRERPLTYDEREAISVKVQFWWHVARLQGGNVAFERVKASIIPIIEP